MWYLEQLMWVRASSSLWYVPNAWQRHMLTALRCRCPAHACLNAWQPPLVKVTAVGGALGWGATAGMSWYVERVMSVKGRMEKIKSLPPWVKACGGTGLVVFDSLNVISLVLAHRRWTAFKRAGGRVKGVAEWIKRGMPDKP